MIEVKDSSIARDEYIVAMAAMLEMLGGSIVLGYEEIARAKRSAPALEMYKTQDPFSIVVRLRP